MINTPCLLPPNSSALEKRLAEANADLSRLPVPIRALWSYTNCPAPLLPHLAWAFSVDRWDRNWTEETKRQVIASSYFVHRHKGTISALRRVVEPLGFLIRIIEWYQEAPEGVPGTFKLDVGVLDQGITEQMYLELERSIDDAKPVSRHLLGLAISMETRGKVTIGVTSLFGDELTVYPYNPGPIEVGGNLYSAGIEHTIDTVSIYP